MTALARQFAAIGAGLALAILTSLVVLGIALVTRASATDAPALMNGLVGLTFALLQTGHPDQLLRRAATLLIATSAAPVIVTALVGTAAKIRHAAWYLGGTAILTLILPVALQGVNAIPARPQMLVVATLAIAGLSAGFVYWTVAIKGARRSSADPSEGDSASTLPSR